MKRILACALLCGVTISSAQAALVDRGGGMIYDDVLNITWLQNANQGAGSTYDDGSNTTDGRMTWAQAMAWAENLAHGGYIDWRLPTALNQDGTGPCLGLNCAGSELGHMFYNNLGGVQFESVLNTTGDTATEIANLLLFGGSRSGNTVAGSSIQSNPYWSGTESAPFPSLPATGAWGFNVNTGDQIDFGLNGEFYAWAVRDGDVAPPVPLPAAAWLLLSGLGGLGVMARRKRVQA